MTINSKADLPAVMALITGRWRSQILYVGVALGVFDALDEEEFADTDALAMRLETHPATTYRLLRALATIGLLQEQKPRRFRLAANGSCLRRDHPQSLQCMAMLEEGPVHYAAWAHLSDLVRSGETDAFQRQFGCLYWDYLQRDAAYARDFSRAMSSYSASDAPAVAEVCRGDDFDSALMCDVGGSHGALISSLLLDHPTARGVVFDLPEVIASRGLQDPGGTRIAYVAGDMFREVPPADVYWLKHIVHDWPDEACRTILRNLRVAARPGARLFICEFIVPGPEQPHFAKIIDLHMMVVQSGQQRTLDELGTLLLEAGWQAKPAARTTATPLSVLEAEIAV